MAPELPAPAFEAQPNEMWHRGPAILAKKLSSDREHSIEEQQEQATASINASRETLNEQQAREVSEFCEGIVEDLRGWSIVCEQQQDTFDEMMQPFKSSCPALAKRSECKASMSAHVNCMRNAALIDGSCPSSLTPWTPMPGERCFDEFARVQDACDVVASARQPQARPVNPGAPILTNPSETAVGSSASVPLHSKTTPAGERCILPSGTGSLPAQPSSTQHDMDGIAALHDLQRIQQRQRDSHAVRGDAMSKISMDNRMTVEALQNTQHRLENDMMQTIHASTDREAFLRRDAQLKSYNDAALRLQMQANTIRTQAARDLGIVERSIKDHNDAATELTFSNALFGAAAPTPISTDKTSSTAKPSDSVSETAVEEHQPRAPSSALVISDTIVSSPSAAATKTSSGGSVRHRTPGIMPVQFCENQPSETSCRYNKVCMPDASNNDVVNCRSTCPFEASRNSTCGFVFHMVSDGSRQYIMQDSTSQKFCRSDQTTKRLVVCDKTRAEDVNRFLITPPDSKSNGAIGISAIDESGISSAKGCTVGKRGDESGIMICRANDVKRAWTYQAFNI